MERLTDIERTAIENGYNAAPTDGPSGPDDPLHVAVERIIAARAAELEAALATAQARLGAVEALADEWQAIWDAGKAMRDEYGNPDGVSRMLFADRAADNLRTALMG